MSPSSQQSLLPIVGMILKLDINTSQIVHETLPLLKTKKLLCTKKFKFSLIASLLAKSDNSTSMGLAVMRELTLTNMNIKLYFTPRNLSFLLCPHN